VLVTFLTEGYRAGVRDRWDADERSGCPCL